MNRYIPQYLHEHECTSKYMNYTLLSFIDVHYKRKVDCVQLVYMW